MGQYRDDLDAAHQRIASLEAEVVRLAGGPTPAPSPPADETSPAPADANGDAARAARRAELKRRARGPDLARPEAPWYARSPRAAGAVALAAAALAHGGVARALFDGPRVASLVAASGLAFAVAAYPIYRGASIVANPWQRHEVRTEHGPAEETFTRPLGAALALAGMLCDALGLALVARLAHTP